MHVITVMIIMNTTSPPFSPRIHNKVHEVQKKIQRIQQHKSTKFTKSTNPQIQEIHKFTNP